MCVHTQLHVCVRVRAKLPMSDIPAVADLIVAKVMYQYYDADAIRALLGELRGGHAILLVEHDMDAVFRVADRITVMVNGAVIASGTPEEVRSSPEVQAAYLGGH